MDRVRLLPVEGRGKPTSEEKSNQRKKKLRNWRKFVSGLKFKGVDRRKQVLPNKTITLSVAFKQRQQTSR